MHYVRDVVEPVDDFFQMVVNFVSDKKRQSAAADIRLIEFAQADIVQFVGASFDGGNLRRQIADMARLRR